MTMTLVSTVTVGAGGAASIEWTGIPATGTDLLVVVSARHNNATYGDTNITFNSSGTGYSARLLYADAINGGAKSTTGIYGFTTPSDYTANTFGNLQIYVPNYAGSTNKSFSVDSVTENNATGAWSGIHAGLWSNTAAITSLKVAPYSGLFVQYSTASLYTITKGSGGATVS
jgi:hypothetical protein